MAEEQKPIHMDAEHARAGATPGVTRYVLIISMILVVAIFALILWR